jgi:hypothetical protein
LLDITLMLAYSQHGRSHVRGRPIAHPSHHVIYDEDDGSHVHGQHMAHSGLSHDLDAVDEGAQSDNLDPDHDQHFFSTHNDNDLDPQDDVSQAHNDPSRGPSCTPSSSETTLKRRASSCESLKETKIQKTSSGRPKAADYDDSDKALILSAISHYRTELGTVTAFPDNAKEAEMLGQVWQEACVRLDITGSITPRIAKLVRFSRLSHLSVTANH